MEDLPIAESKAVSFLGLEEDKVFHLLEDFREAYEQDKSNLTASA